MYANQEDLLNCKYQIDFVLLAANNIEKLVQSAKSIAKIIDHNTIILLDSSYANGLEDKLSAIFPDNLVLSLCSDVLITVVVYDRRTVFNHIGNKVATIIGSGSLGPNKMKLEALSGSNQLGKTLNNLIQILLSQGVFPCNIIQNGVKPTIKSYIWKNILSFVTFGVLSLIYGELKTDNKIHNLMMKKVFNDILKLACENCKDEFPQLKDKNKCKQLFDQIMKQFNQTHSQYQILFSEENKSYVDEDESLQYPVCISNFLKHYDTYIPLCLHQLLNTAKENKEEVPYIECIDSFYSEIDKINGQKLYNWIKREAYQVEKPLRLPEVNCSSNTLASDTFDVAKNGSSTPLTPMSNSVHYQQQIPEGMVMIPKGDLENLFKNSPINYNANYGQKVVLPHPRFKNIPKKEVDGKKIPYNQIKELLYQNTKGSTIPGDLTQAHKHIYQHANLNNIFESVNNRYGWADSLDAFKVSSGIKEKHEESPQGITAEVDTSNAEEKSVDKSSNNSGSDVEMMDAREESPSKDDD